MFYFSEFINRKVVNENNTLVGKVKDLRFVAEEQPLITQIIVKKRNRKSTFAIPVKKIQEIRDAIVVSSDFEPKDIRDGEFSVAKNLLNRQIIDVAGGKVVRVNDVAVQDREREEYYIAGVDVGFRAILRWFKLEKATEPLYKFLKLYSRPHFLSWADIEPLELSRGKIQMKKNIGDLERMRPEDLADYLEKTNIRNIDKTIKELNEKYAADVIEDLNVNYQTALFKRFAPERASNLINHLDPDEAVDILLTLSKDKRNEILDSLEKGKNEELRELIKYSKTSVGKLITPDFITVFSEDSVSKALEKVKEQLSESKFSTYIYVENSEKHLVGVFNLDELLIRDSDIPIYKIMEQDVIAAHLTTPKEIALKRMLKYRLYALPVIEGNQKMLGVITFDDMIEEVAQEYGV
jgi:sporulation protein YlmC with PRC-barrel domain/predicted transcriptional regulator